MFAIDLKLIGINFMCEKSPRGQDNQTLSSRMVLKMKPIWKVT